MSFKNLLLSTLAVLLFANSPVDRYQQIRHQWNDAKVESYKNSVTIIRSMMKDGGWAEGTGVVIAEDGATLTAAHLFDDPDMVEVLMKTTNGNVYRMGLCAIDFRRDLAIIRPLAASPTFKFLPIQKSKEVEVNSDILVIGHPLWMYYDVQNGVILGTEFHIFYFGEIERISALVRPGNSGGPVLNTNGQVVGIVSASVHDILTLSFKYGIAVSISEIHTFVNKAYENKKHWPKQTFRYRLGDVKN